MQEGHFVFGYELFLMSQSILLPTNLSSKLTCHFIIFYILCKK